MAQPSFDPAPPSSLELTRDSGLAQVLAFDELESTQATAAKLADEGTLLLPGAVVAWRQTAGRGRAGNKWWSDGGSLTVTFALPVEPARHRPLQQLPLRVGVAIRDSLLTWAPSDRLSLKWPNDLLSDGRKLAGILCERVRTADLVGVGINVNADFSLAPPDIRARSVSLAEISNRSPDRRAVFAAIARAVQTAWSLDDWNTSFNHCHALQGKHIGIESDGVTIWGRCEGVDPDGFLLLHDGQTTRRIMNGTVVKPQI